MIYIPSYFSLMGGYEKASYLYGVDHRRTNLNLAQVVLRSRCQ